MSAGRLTCLAAALSLMFGLGCRASEAPLAEGSARPAVIENAMSIHELTLPRLDGTPESLRTYEGKVILLVNTASACGYTPQYEGLEALWKELGPKGFVVLGFPSNDFGAQEPGSSEEIATFCKKNFGVTFPMFEKVTTKGPGATELFKILGAAAGEPKWNFHKYLIDKKGKVLQAFPSAVKPDSAELRKAIDAALSS